MSDTPRKVARWTAADIALAEHGGFVTYGDFLTLAEENARLRSELAQAESKIYVPGFWSCAKCKLILLTSTLSPAGVLPDNRPQQCPNECGPMWRVTERDQRKEAQALYEQEVERRQQAEAKLAAARRELAQVEAERNGLRKGVETAENIARRAEHRANQLESDMAAARSEGWAAGMQRAKSICIIRAARSTPLLFYCEEPADWAGIAQAEALACGDAISAEIAKGE